MSTPSEAWDAVDTGRWIRNDDLDRLDRNLATNTSHGKQGTKHQTRTKEHHLREVRETYSEDGVVPSAERVAEHSDSVSDGSGAVYEQLADTWDETLRLAGVPAVVDVIAEWIADRQADPARSARTFRAADVAGDVGLSPQAIGKALDRLYDGHAIDPATRFEGQIVVVLESGATLWGVES